jgi:hypothetical protein
MAGKIHGVADVKILDPDPHTGKPYLEVTFHGVKETILMTTNLAEMLGGVGKGARLRYEDQNPS